MRLGSRKTVFQPGSESAKIRALYGGVQEIEERHRHRYEINPEYIGKLEAAGLQFVGKDETGQRMEIFEIKDHPYFVGTQFHAEYQSKVLSPSVSSNYIIHFIVWHQLTTGTEPIPRLHCCERWLPRQGPQGRAHNGRPTH